MYERFTDRSRKVFKLSNQEAMRFNHEYIGTEHILIGLIKEGTGVACNVLKILEIDLQKVRLEIEKLVQSGPEMTVTGKLPHTPRSKKVVEYAIDESHKLNHSYVGTEHVLLGLLREQEGVAYQVLTNLGVKAAKVREEVLALLGCTKRKTSQVITATVFEPPNDPKANVTIFRSEDFDTHAELEKEIQKLLTTLGPKNVIYMIHRETKRERIDREHLTEARKINIYEIWHWDVG